MASPKAKAGELVAAFKNPLPRDLKPINLPHNIRDQTVKEIFQELRAAAAARPWLLPDEKFPLKFYNCHRKEDPPSCQCLITAYDMRQLVSDSAYHDFMGREDPEHPRKWLLKNIPDFYYPSSYDDDAKIQYLKVIFKTLNPPLDPFCVTLDAFSINPNPDQLKKEKACLKDLLKRGSTIIKDALTSTLPSGFIKPLADEEYIKDILDEIKKNSQKYDNVLRMNLVEGDLDKDEKNKLKTLAIMSVLASRGVSQLPSLSAAASSSAAEEPPDPMIEDVDPYGYWMPGYGPSQASVSGSQDTPPSSPQHDAEEADEVLSIEDAHREERVLSDAERWGAAVKNLDDMLAMQASGDLTAALEKNIKEEREKIKSIINDGLRRREAQETFYKYLDKAEKIAYPPDERFVTFDAGVFRPGTAKHGSISFNLKDYLGNPQIEWPSVYDKGDAQEMTDQEIQTNLQELGIGILLIENKYYIIKIKPEPSSGKRMKTVISFGCFDSAGNSLLPEMTFPSNFYPNVNPLSMYVLLRIINPYYAILAKFLGDRVQLANYLTEKIKHPTSAISSSFFITGDLRAYLDGMVLQVFDDIGLITLPVDSLYFNTVKGTTEVIATLVSGGDLAQMKKDFEEIQRRHKEQAAAASAAKARETRAAEAKEAMEARVAEDRKIARRAAADAETRSHVAMFDERALKKAARLAKAQREAAEKAQRDRSRSPERREGEGRGEGGGGRLFKKTNKNKNKK